MADKSNNYSVTPNSSARPAERQFQKYDASNLKISKARKAAQAALAIKPTEMVVFARISCMVGFSNPGTALTTPHRGRSRWENSPSPHHSRPPKLDCAG